ncbi:hypothetical protein D3C78_1445130 [compost metagenome]
MVELFAAPGVNEASAFRKHCQTFAVQKPHGLFGQRQQADENIACREDGGQSGFAVMAGYAVDRARGTAPAGKWKTEGFQPLQRRNTQHAEAENAHAALFRLTLRQSLPELLALLF